MLRTALEQMIEREKALTGTTETSPETCPQPWASTVACQQVATASSSDEDWMS
jgi:hypothetical protein